MPFTVKLVANYRQDTSRLHILSAQLTFHTEHENVGFRISSSQDEIRKSVLQSDSICPPI